MTDKLIYAYRPIPIFCEFNSQDYVPKIRLRDVFCIQNTKYLFEIENTVFYICIYIHLF